MEIAELVLKYLQSLAWPLVALASVLVFRSELSALFARVTEASAFGATLKLEKTAERAAAASEELPELAGTNVPAADSPRPPSHTSDLGRIVFEWRNLEKTSSELTKQFDLPKSSQFNVQRTVQELANRGLVSRELVSLSRQLQSLRNELIHKTDDKMFTPSFAEDFVEAIRNLNSAMRVIRDGEHTN